MLFTSLPFLAFFIVVFAVYYFLSRYPAKAQNLLLLLASYYFYGYVDWRMTALLLVLTVVFYVVGIGIDRFNESAERKASWLTTLGVCIGVGTLLYFKYLNFFIESFADLFTALGLRCNAHTFNIVLPVGVSFFTFKLISYVIEVHHQKMPACRDFVAFATYVSFFPTIMSGPIDRPNRFIPQLAKARAFDADRAIQGCVQFAWGMLSKVAIADRIAAYIDPVLDAPGDYGGNEVLFAALLYPVQMYADFSGYSDMAIGVGKILGINVAQNFKFPFFGRNIAEYWRNWHISLTGWLTDYVFMPLNVKFRSLEAWGSVAAIVITFVLIGMWHGATWNFAIFGLYHGLLYIPLMLSGGFFKKKKIKTTAKRLPPLSDVTKMVGTYLLVAFGLIIFRNTTADAFLSVVSGVLQPWRLSTPGFTIFLMIALLLVHDLHGAFKTFPALDKLSPVMRTAFYMIIIMSFGMLDNEKFIYFQF